MILLGYFLDLILSNYLFNTPFYSMLFLVFSYFNYNMFKKFGLFVLFSSIECLVASLVFNSNFFLDFSYLLLFYYFYYSKFRNYSFDVNIKSSIVILILILGYYLYGWLLFLLMGRPISILSNIFNSILINLVIVVIVSYFFGLCIKKR